MKVNMTSNLEKYKKDLDDLANRGENLLNAMKAKFLPETSQKRLKKSFKDEKEVQLQSFISDYQTWYSEVLVLLKQLLPDRVDDFVRLYKKPETREIVTFENYVIEDALVGLHAGKRGEEIAGPKDAIPRFRQQLSILKSLKRRFESSLFDIKSLVQADLFNNELAAARELNEKGFFRCAGAMAGVVLESHLSQVCKNHKLQVDKERPSINDYNQTLKKENVIDITTFFFIQFLASVRNLCDHKKEKDPTKERIEELINGVEKIIKTIL